MKEAAESFMKILASKILVQKCTWSYGEGTTASLTIHLMTLTDNSGSFTDRNPAGVRIHLWSDLAWLFLQHYLLP